MRTRMIALIIIAFGALSAGAQAQDKPTFAERLGWPKGSRVVIFHSDDAGMSHSSNVGVIEGIEKGLVTSASTMMPCGWVPEWAKYMKEHPEFDNGLHLTLTSEWENYRWMPVAGSAAVPTLSDEQGCLWDNVELASKNATPDDIEKEIRAQVERAQKMGLPITHLDTHMGTVYARPDFLERYIKVGVEKHIPIMIMGGHMTHTIKSEGEAVAALKTLGIGEKVWEGGLPVLDDLITYTYDVKTFDEKKAMVIDALRTLKPGVTQIIVHCTRPTEEFAFITTSGETRLNDLLVVIDPEVKKAVEDEKIILSTWRELQQRRDKAGK
ncbi:MAG: polysaccharide deacetylase family protein [Candidatus Hydrogenedentales bacterium]